MMIPQPNSELARITERVDALERFDGSLLTELAIVNTKLDFIQGLLEERPSRVEMKSHNALAQQQIDSIRVKAGEVVKFSKTQSYFLKLGAVIVGGIGGLEVWLKVRSVLFGLLGIK